MYLRPERIIDVECLVPVNQLQQESATKSADKYGSTHELSPRSRNVALKVPLYENQKDITAKLEMRYTLKCRLKRALCIVFSSYSN